MAGRAKNPTETAAGVSTLPSSLQPQLATLVEQAPDGDAWLHEIKYDGYRLLARLWRGEWRLFTRNGHDWTQRFPSLASALSRLPVESAWFDGEVMALLDDGRSSFAALQQRLSDGHDGGLVYMIFDLVYLDGRSLRRTPLGERKQVLARLLAGSELPDALRYSDHVQGNGRSFFHQACTHGLEGVVSKRRDSPYVAGRGKDWRKSKCQRRQEFVIAGFTESSAPGRPFGALLLGEFKDGQLHYTGRVGTGFNARTSRSLYEQLRALETSQSAFAQRPASVRRERLRWVRPQLVAEVRFSNWTADGVLRHATFQGVREDKDASEVVHEPTASADGPLGHADARRQGRSLAGVTLSNPEKVLYPGRGVSKRELAFYYKMVASRILPYLQDRPLTLLRCPDGHHKDCFYQRHLTGELPAGIDAVAVRNENAVVRYPVVRSARGLISLVQWGTLEVHAWGARVDRLDRADQITFDLDPGPKVAWGATVQAALLLRTLLEGLGLEGFLKTTGGKGLHVVVPVERRYSWDEIKGFAKAVARQLVRFDPATFSAQLTKAGREDKIFVDYLRNSRGATAIVPFSTRAREDAPVAMPISWDDLEAGVRSDEFTVRQVDALLQRTDPDPWRGFAAAAARLTQSMWAALERR